MKKRIIFGFIFILILVSFFGIVAWPKTDVLDFSKFKINVQKDVKLKLGLDLQGGTHLVYEVDLSAIKTEDQSRAVESVIEVIRRRVDAFGIGEPIIQSSQIGGKERVIVELPGVKDISSAVSLIGKTAQLTFKEIDATGKGWKATGLNGSHLVRADTQTNSQSGSIEVAIEFNAEGQRLFAEITKRNLQKPVAIFLDNDVVSAPTVQSVIDDGKAVITGNFDLDTAKQLSIQLNAGALPAPLELVEQRSVGATLGQESIRASVIAGMAGFILIVLYILIYYRLLGLVGTLNLGAYTVFVFALFKLIPVTLTLSGIAGFILSLGMALEANLLFFERLREELRKGRAFSSALDAGYEGAWSSIWDSNFVSFIICVILYSFGTGMVIGFAFTLMIGILVSLILLSLFTRPLVYFIGKTPLTKYRWLFAVEKAPEEKI